MDYASLPQESKEDASSVRICYSSLQTIGEINMKLTRIFLGIIIPLQTAISITIYLSGRGGAAVGLSVAFAFADILIIRFAKRMGGGIEGGL
jgi:hypothetical protein